MDKEVNNVIKIAKEAGTILMKYWKSDYDLKIKDEFLNDPVTTADIESEKLIIERLENIFPDDEILGEESEKKIKNWSKRVWIIDPLDGTRLFANGFDTFSVNIGLCLDGKPDLGVVFLPARDELFYAKKGQGSFLIKNNKTKKLKCSAVETLINSKQAMHNSEGRGKFEQIQKKIKARVKEYTTAIGALYIASGEFDFFIHPFHMLRKWDTCAPQIIIEEAGGKLSYMNGGSLNYKKEGNSWDTCVIYSNGTLHKIIINEIKKLK